MYLKTNSGIFDKAKESWLKAWPIIGTEAYSPRESVKSDNLDILISFWKRLRSCVKYRIPNYLTFSGLFPQFGAFTAMVDGVEVPKDIHDVLKDPKWK